LKPTKIKRITLEDGLEPPFWLTYIGEKGIIWNKTCGDESVVLLKTCGENIQNSIKSNNPKHPFCPPSPQKNHGLFRSMFHHLVK
jgi:hypothetical protein